MKCYSEEVDSRSCGEFKKQKKTAEELGSRRGGGKEGDGSSNEVVKRRRGRPSGSKNKPQPPVVITREFTDSSPAMRPHVLEIPAGHDVAASLAAFSRRRALGLCVLAASGPVANVTLRQSPFPVEGSPSAAAAVVTFGGRFDILSISATFFPPSLPAAAGGLGGGFSVSLGGPHGRVVGGMVAGPLVAAGTVVVVAAGFAEPTFDRLPVEEETAGSASASLSAAGGSGGGDEVAARPHHDEDDHDEEAQYHYQHDHFHRHHHHGSSDGTPIYAGHFPPDVLWTPTARSPHLPPPPPPPYRFT
uniref:AT-hook motif nuclear-localized protein 28 n=1 Tax=Elaeis guineensis var. tenera TaxID=51953 RepID=A0A6I9QXK6_ELAGV|nr:AT-hook motif nuclear-localized protein 28 [Elaeis guineensis]